MRVAIALATGFVLGWMGAFLSALYASKGGIKPVPAAEKPAWLDELEDEARDYEWPEVKDIDYLTELQEAREFWDAVEAGEVDL